MPFCPQPQIQNQNLVQTLNQRLISKPQSVYNQHSALQLQFLKSFVINNLQSSIISEQKLGRFAAPDKHVVSEWHHTSNLKSTLNAALPCINFLHPSDSAPISMLLRTRTRLKEARGMHTAETARSPSKWTKVGTLLLEMTATVRFA